jgi:hypothetical protein
MAYPNPNNSDNDIQSVEKFATTIRHASFGALDCLGCLDIVVCENGAVAVCNECGVMVRAIQAVNRN